MSDYTGQFTQNINKIPGIDLVYKACDWSFNKSMDLVGKINPEWETYLRANQGFVTLALGFGVSYGVVRAVEIVPRWFFRNILHKENWAENYDNLLSLAELFGYGINIAIPLAIQIFHPGGIQALLEEHPVFTPGLIGLEVGSSIAAAHERRNRVIRRNIKLEERIEELQKAA